MKKRKKVKGRKKCVSKIVFDFWKVKNCYFMNLQLFLGNKIHFPTGKYSMYRCKKAFDKKHQGMYVDLVPKMQ